MGSVKVLFLLLTLFTFHVRAPESKSDHCDDLWTAKKSNRINFCIAEHWSKLKPTGQRDNVCDICLKMVKEARDTLRSNETREQLMEVFEGSCRLLVLKPAVELCDSIVDQLVPELVEILSSEMDPEAVCSVAKLCNNEVFRVAQKNSKECVNCERFTEAAAKEMESVSSESFEKGVLSLCRTAGGFSDACSYLGSKYSDLFYNNTKIILSKKPCEATSLCPSGLIRSKPVRETEKQMCTLCMKVMTSLREQFLRVKSAGEFSENILSACKRMNFSDSTCSDLSSPLLYEKVRNLEKLPQIFCQITYCGKKSDAEIFPVWPLLPAHNGSFSSAEMDALELLKNLEMFFPVMNEEKTERRKPVISYGDPIENPFFFAPRLYIGETGNCKTCTRVLETLSKSAETGEEYSEGMLNTICDSVEDIDMCKQFVSHFSPVLTKAYAEGVISAKMCEDLAPSCKIKQNDLPGDAASSERTCNFCLNAIGMLKRSDYVSWGQKKCNSLSEHSKDMCTSVFGKIHSVFENFTENEICSNVQLCGPSAIILPNISYVRAVDNLNNSLCEVCIETVEFLSNFSKNPNSEVVIRVVFESLCYMLPYAEGKMCFHLIDIMGVKNLIKYLQNLKPREICSEIFLCKKEERLDSVVASDLPKEITSVEAKVPCKFCLMAIRTLLDQLQDDKTEESIRKALDGLCKYFPEETRDTCRNLIDQYTGDIIDMIIADFNATEICVYLKLCPARNLLEDVDEKDFPAFDIQTNEVRYWDGRSWRLGYRLSNFEVVTVERGKPSEKEFQNFHKVVQECALCEALVGVISTHEKMLNKDYDFSANAHVICAIVPRDKKRMCMTMVVSYGPSIVNLLTDQKVDPNEVCVRVDLCDPKMQAKVSQPVSVVEEKFIPKKENSCLLGPKFWCANAENAEKCGTFLHCQEMVWKNWKNPPRRPSED